MYRSKVIIVGSINIDICGYVPVFPVPGETVVGSSLSIGVGGKGNNQATAALRAGSEVVFISKLGDDFLKNIAIKHLIAEKIPMDYIPIENCETGSAVIEVEESTGQNRIAIIKGANGLVSRDDVYKAEKEFCDCGAVLTQLETSMESIKAAKELANKNNVSFILNPAPYQPLSPELIFGTDYITPNETEAGSITGITVDTDKDVKKAGEILLSMGIKNVIITLGSRGSYFTDGNKEVFIPAIKCKVVDTVGAGDCFNGAFASAIASGKEVIDSLKFATAAASISVSRKGAAASNPYLYEIEELLR
ncbi:MAG: ribokinase [Clostridiaceae bacterium]|nr:ribokinase [Clostridiaceae bacterium]